MPVVHKKDKRSGHFSPLLISILLTIILFIVFITFYLKNIFFDNSINQFYLWLFKPEAYPCDAGYYFPGEA